MKRFLIVDDEYPIRQWLQYILKNHFPTSTITLCSDGEEALAALAQQSFDVLITDIKMPRCDGLRLLKTIAEWQEKPVILVLSSFDDFQYVRTTFQYAAVDYLLKAEVTEEQLIACIQTHSRKGMQIQLQLEKAIPRLLEQDGCTTEDFAKTLSPLPISDNGADCFWFLSQGGDDFNLLPQSNLTVAFCSAIAPNTFLGLASCQTPSRLMQLSARNELIMACRRTNQPSLLLVTEYATDWHSLHLLARTIYTHRKLGFYGAFTMEITTQHQEYEQAFQAAYYALLVAVQKPNTSGQWMDALHLFFEAIQTIKYPKIDSLKARCLRVMEYLYLQKQQPTTAMQPTYLKTFATALDETTSWSQMVALLEETVHDMLQKPQTGCLPEAIAKTLDYIECNFAQDITLQTVADHVFLNPDYFSRYFKKHMHCTFITYLNQVRMEKAKALLQNSNLKISDVSQSVGFHNFNYFSKAFKQAYGVTPMEYRKKVP